MSIMIWILLTLSSTVYTDNIADFQDTLAIDYRSKENLNKYWLPSDHPLKASLDVLFSQPGRAENVQSLREAGFEIMDDIPMHPAILRHPAMRGYVFKLYLDSNKYTREGISSAEWLLRRCQGAEKIRNIIHKKGCLYFTVPDKWLYALPFAKHHPLILIATDMEVLGKQASAVAWKTQITPRHLDELYYILKKGYGSIELLFNIPFTKNGTFTFIDTEQPKRHLHLNRVKKYLSKDMRRYWQKILDQ
jgi:hypothetical protein